MSLPAAALRKMLEMGLTLDQAVELAEVWEAGAALEPPTLSKGAERTRRWRERLEATGLSGEAWRALSSRIIGRDGGRCRYCGNSKGRMCCDHVTPLIAGGDNSDGNLVAACDVCNGGKSGRSVEEWKGVEWAQRWRAGLVTGDITRGITGDVSHVGAGAQVVTPFSSSLQSEEVGVGGVERERAPFPDPVDWPAGNASAHAELLISTVASPWLDPMKSADLVTTRGRLAAWKREGASWEFDVVPVVTGLCANRRSRVSSWKFFDQAIARSIAENRAALEIPSAQPRATGPPSLTDRISAENREAERLAFEMLDARDGRTN